MEISEIKLELQNIVMELNKIINNADIQQKEIRAQEAEEKFNWLVAIIRAMRAEAQALYDSNGLAAMEADEALRCIIAACTHIDRIESAYNAENNKRVCK